MLVRDRMTRRVITIDPARPLSDAHRLLVRHRIRQLPVVRDGQLVGIITHRDLRAARPINRSVASTMTAKPFTVGPDLAIDEAARRLRMYKIGGLPVLDRKQLVGIITVADVLDAFVALSGAAEATHHVAITGRGRALEERARRAVERAHVELRWIHRRPRVRPPELLMRVKVKRADDLVTALEAAGLDVLRVVASPPVA
jgi:acetoin utilization protein AcuB